MVLTPFCRSNNDHFDTTENTEKIRQNVLWVVTLAKTISIKVQGAVSSAVLFFRKPISVGQSTYKVGKGAPFLKSVYIRKPIYCFSELKLNFCASHVTSSYVVLHHVLVEVL